MGVYGLVDAGAEAECEGKAQGSSGGQVYFSWAVTESRVMVSPFI